MYDKNRIRYTTLRPGMTQRYVPANGIRQSKMHFEVDLRCNGQDSFRAGLLLRYSKDFELHMTILIYKLNGRKQGYFVFKKQDEVINSCSIFVDNESTWYQEVLQNMNVEKDIQDDATHGFRLIEQLLKMRKSVTIKEKIETTVPFPVHSEKITAKAIEKIAVKN